MQVLTTLRFLAKGDYLSEVADMHGISLSSASRIIHSVCSALCLCLDNIRFPTTLQDLKRVKDEFYKIQNFPNVVGAIDGTLIPIQGMAGEEEPTFICRKGFHAINVQAVAVANLRYIIIITSLNYCFKSRMNYIINWRPQSPIYMQNLVHILFLAMHSTCINYKKNVCFIQFYQHRSKMARIDPWCLHSCEFLFTTNHGRSEWMAVGWFWLSTEEMAADTNCSAFQPAGAALQLLPLLYKEYCRESFWHTQE